MVEFLGRSQEKGIILNPVYFPTTEILKTSKIKKECNAFNVDIPAYYFIR